ncbi:hypothetical protein Vadar_031804 [Vaccinium darrowii]|uniref:Uncharacterized protein n=1 Tax=Vaccinium darrowii TaxID=229202 RepID=A0ACB7XUV0_9ERIC|nr:hypothetical protein Vadar_031804 [Vaccinium darrowii]
MFKIGPAGGNTYDGKNWDEKGRNGIAQIFISHGERIHSLQFQFVDNGTLVLSKQHGGNLHCASKFSAVKLNYPSEFITGINGYSGKRNYGQCVTSIIFTTNIATYGPFGRPAGDDIAFDYQIGGHNKFCGFYGSASGYLDSIGVYMEPMTTLSNVNSSRHSVHIPEQTKELVKSLKLDVDKIKQQSEKSSIQLQKELIDLISKVIKAIIGD